MTEWVGRLLKGPSSVVVGCLAQGHLSRSCTSADPLPAGSDQWNYCKLFLCIFNEWKGLKTILSCGTFLRSWKDLCEFIVEACPSSTCPRWAPLELTPACGGSARELVHEQHITKHFTAQTPLVPTLANTSAFIHQTRESTCTCIRVCVYWVSPLWLLLAPPPPPPCAARLCRFSHYLWCRWRLERPSVSHSGYTDCHTSDRRAREINGIIIIHWNDITHFSATNSAPLRVFIFLNEAHFSTH